MVITALVRYRPLRDRAEMITLYAHVRAQFTDGRPRSARDESILDGTLGALEWVLGETDTGPVTGRVMPDRHPVYLRSEEAAAQDVIELLRPVPDNMTIEYVGAVYYAIQWARGLGGDDPPPHV